MAQFVFTLFMIVCAFGGVHSATVDIDGDCDPAADTCTDSNAGRGLQLVCDTQVTPDAKCRILADQSCPVDKCVTGATCDGSTTTCDCGSNTKTSDNLCAAANQVGGTCTGGPNAKGTCTDVNAICSADDASGRCSCKSGYTTNTALTCDIQDNKIGGSCTTSTANTKGTCEDANAQCSATTNGICGCKTGYTGTNGGGCAVPDGKVGGSCSAASVNVKGNCEDANALCSAITNGKCFCKTGYTGEDGGTCAIQAGKFGGSCTATTANTKGTCEDANAQCSATTSGTCGCKSGYTGTDGGGCVEDKKVGGACTGPNQGTCVDSNAVCVTSRCVCSNGYSGQIGGGCTKIADNTFGGRCTTDTADTKGSCKDTNAICPQETGGFCACATGYTGTDGGGCALPDKLGGSCTTQVASTTGTCTDANTVCSAQVGGRCVVAAKGGTVTIMASAMTVVLAALVGLLVTQP